MSYVPLKVSWKRQCLLYIRIHLNLWDDQLQWSLLLTGLYDINLYKHLYLVVSSCSFCSYSSSFLLTTSSRFLTSSSRVFMLSSNNTFSLVNLHAINVNINVKHHAMQKWIKKFRSNSGYWKYLNNLFSPPRTSLGVKGWKTCMIHHNSQLDEELVIMKCQCTKTTIE